MRSEDFSDEELAQAMQPKPTPVPQQTVPQQTVPQQMHEISKNASLNPLQEVIKSESKPELDGNYWPIENLPSKYKLYPPGTKLYARPLKVLEVKMLSSLTNENFHHIITEVLKKTVKGIEVENLLVADKLFIIFWLRANTYKNSGYTVDFDCDACNSHSKFEFEIDNLEIIDIKDDYDPNKSVKLPQSGDEIRTRQLTIRDENNVKNFLVRNKRSMTDYDEEILIIANLIDTINNQKLSLTEKYNYVINMGPIDFGKFETYLEHYDMGISPIMNVTCHNCGGTAPAAVSFRADFFVPKAGLD